MDTQTVFEKNSMLFRFAHQEKFQIWLDHILFTWRWWLGIVIILICLWGCYQLTRNESGNRLLFAGFFTALVATCLDLIGVFFGLWDYRYEVFPSINTYLPWDLLVVPTLVMALLRIKPYANPFVKALVLGAFTSFIGLPLLDWMGLYEPLHWNYIYSFPIQVVLYLLADFVSRRGKFAPLRD
ncbi:CBO0543 family protein [Virgibacillus siamensis]|uniref:CBO0543 family protein n=1 Tax=Virgibacillus siamensis TaxID=480071 RepID=UPI0031DB9004